MFCDRLVNSRGWSRQRQAQRDPSVVLRIHCIRVKAESLLLRWQLPANKVQALHAEVVQAAAHRECACVTAGFGCAPPRVTASFGLVPARMRTVA